MFERKAIYGNLRATKTLTKAELLRALSGVKDDDKVYIMATKAVVEKATAGALVEPHDVYFALGGDVQYEIGGVSLIADFIPAK